VLTVQGYSNTVGLGVCRGIPSGIFSVGGHTWKIIYYPDGHDSFSDDCISIYLLIQNTDATNVEVSCRFSLLDQLGEPVPEYTTAEGHITEFPRFIKREELDNSTYLKDDCFSIRCDVSVSKGIRVQPTTQLVPPPDMLHQFGRMLETGVGADITFEVGGEMFAAHRRLLAARSSVFMAQLFGPAKENDATLIQIKDMEAKVFKMMLHFIYTDTLPSIDDGVIMEMAQHLFVVAGRYNLERLKLICTNMLCDRINNTTVALMLAFAEQHGCDGVKKACFKFVASSQNLKTATTSDGLKII
jgi:speckle-type POZ protein